MMATALESDLVEWIDDVEVDTSQWYTWLAMAECIRCWLSQVCQLYMLEQYRVAAV